MAVVRLYVDEDASEHAVVQALRRRGYDVLTTLEAGRTQSEDSQQLAFAAAEGRAVYTFNVGDFARLHRQYLAEGRDHAGIIVIPDQRYSIGEKIKRIASLLQRLRSQEMFNRMEYL